MQRHWRSPLAVLLAGCVHTLSFAPFEAWWLQCGALAVLAWAAGGAGVRRAAGFGWLFALGWLASGWWWLYISMHDYGGMPAPLAALAVLALAAAMALYYAAALGIWAALRSGRSGWHGTVFDALLGSACWLGAELARATFLTGFPWSASGYAHTVGPLAAAAPWIGVYGLSALGAFTAWSLASALRRGAPLARLAPLAVAGLLVALFHGLPDAFTRSTGRLAVSLLQPNVAQDLKFDPERLGANLDRLLAQVREARGTLVVTPESVVPMTRAELSDAWWGELKTALAQPGRGVLLGIFTGDEAAGYVNSMVGWSSATPDAPEYRYGKRHLLPFGEFVPPGFRWFVDLMAIPLGDQAHGTSSASFDMAGQRLRPLICYEDLFGEDIVESSVGPAAATIFVNASNLAWFGRWLVQDQHLQFSQMRALEFQRPVIRSTNTGATAVVDHHGRVTERLVPLTTGILEAEVEGRTGETPYARWLAAFGLWPLALFAVALPAGAAWRRRRERGAS